MCGLTGFSTKKKANLPACKLKLRNNILTGLLLSMQSRGTDSTGIAGMFEARDKKRVYLLKDAVNADKFVQGKKYIKFLESNPRCLIAHTRWSTIGAVTPVNAHPFIFDDIVGCHNGSVYNHAEVYPQGEVDSEAIFYLLAKYKNDYKTAFIELQGLFAITWFDKSNQDKLYFVVDGNPLNLVYIPELSTYFWSSELLSMQAVIGSHMSLKHLSFWSPHPKQVYCLSSDNSITKKKIEFKVYISDLTPGFDYKAWKRKPSKEFSIIDDEPVLTKTDHDIILNQSQSTDNYRKIMNLSKSEMGLILETMFDNCSYCEQPLYAYTDGICFDIINKTVICNDCGIGFDSWGNIVYIAGGELDEMEIELKEVEELNLIKNTKKYKTK